MIWGGHQTFARKINWSPAFFCLTNVLMKKLAMQLMSYCNIFQTTRRTWNTKNFKQAEGEPYVWIR